MMLGLDHSSCGGYSSIVVGRFVFFFKQKTAYEIRNCDWSSDVCSSDLLLLFLSFPFFLFPFFPLFSSSF